MIINVLLMSINIVTLSRRNTRLSNGLDERKRGFRTIKTQTQRLAQQQRLARILNICLLQVEPFNPYKSSDLFVERRQIVQTQTRRHSAASRQDLHCLLAEYSITFE